MDGHVVRVCTWPNDITESYTYQWQGSEIYPAVACREAPDRFTRPRAE